MRRFFLILLMLLAGAGFPRVAHASRPQAGTFIRRGTELFDSGRWNDARHEFLRARRSLTASDVCDRQKVDYYLAACAVELGASDAEAALKRFSERWPRSVYANDVRFALASYYCARGDMRAAAETFAGVDYPALDPPRRAQYDMRMGYVPFSAGRYEEAYRYFDRLDPRSEYADHALYYKSYIDYAQGRYAQARTGFKRLAASSAYGPLVPYYALQLEFMEGNYAYVTQHGPVLAQKAAPQHRLELYRVMAESWYRLGDFGQTVAALAAFVREGGEMGRNENYLMGYALYRTARYAEAEDYLRRASGPGDALTQNASYHLADCFVRRGAKREAMQAFALAADDTFDAGIAEDALFNYGKLQYELGGGVFNEAIHVLTRYVERYPQSPRAAQARALLIAAYYNSRNYDAAYAALKMIPAPDADLRAAWQKIACFRAMEAFRSGDKAAAGRLLDESAAVGVSPKYNALTLFWQGELAYAEEDYTLAEARYEGYLRRAPRTAKEYPLAWYNLAYARFSQQKTAAAREGFQRFLTLHTASDSYRADAWNRLGDVYCAERAFSDAAASYDKAIAIGGPEQHYARFQQAMAFGLQHQVESKIEALRKIVAAGEGDYADDAACELGRTYISQERYAEGARVLERFVTAHAEAPQRTQALSDLGLAYLNLGDRTKALRYYDMVVAAAPQSAEAKGALEGIRDIYVSQGDISAYFAYVGKAGLESDLSAVARDSLTFAAAQRLYVAEKHAEAAHALQSYVDDYPKGYYRTDALYYLGDSYLRLGDRDRAIETLHALTRIGKSRYAATALERLAALTWEDKRYAEAASAYRQLFDAVTAPAAREAAMTGYVRAVLAEGDASKVASLAEDVAAQPGAGVTAVRESQYAWAEQLRTEGKWKEALRIYRKLAEEVKSAEGAAAAYYVLKDVFDAGDAAKTEKAAFVYIDRQTPHAYWMAKAYILLGDVYAAKGDAFQARATWQSVADGYAPADDGIVDEAARRIAALN